MPREASRAPRPHWESADRRCIDGWKSSASSSSESRGPDVAELPGRNARGRAAVIIVAGCALAACAGVGASMLLARADAPIAVAVATGILIAAIIAALVALRGVRRLTTPVESFLDGLRGFRDGDFTLRVAGDEAELAVVFNEAADALRARRSDSYQKELLLDMILQASPMAMFLPNPAAPAVF